MTREQRVRLWDAINAVIAASGGSISNPSVARQRAVVAVEREIETIEIRHAAPPWLSDVAKALGMVRPSDGAPLALNWTQAVNGVRDLRDERDKCQKESQQACIALADAFVPKADRAGAHLQGLPRLVAHAIEHHQKLEEELFEARRHPCSDSNGEPMK